MNYFANQSADPVLLAAAPLLARAGGDEVVVIYNSRMPESKAVAEYYARMRQVPEKQIYGFALTTNEEMSRAEFRGFPPNAARATGWKRTASGNLR